MKVATFVIIALFVMSSVALAMNPTNAMPIKADQINDPGEPDSREGGETIADAWFIYALPFNDTGNTCDNINDYDEVCPYTGSLSPDVVYAYEPAADMCVSISLCNSFFDTKVYVYEDNVGNVPIDGCNDDNYDCVNPPVSYTSWIPSVQLLAGHVYYIVVDGYGSGCGDYVLEMTEVDCPTPCDVICVGAPEGEPTCYDGYNDVFNGGCNSDPDIFSIAPVSGGSYTICGESGVYAFDGSTYRDTDWYQIYPCGGVPITITVEAEFGVLAGFVSGIVDCAAPAFITYFTAPECTPTSLTEYLPYGPVAIFVSTSSWDPAFTCGVEYSLTIDGYTEHCDPTPVESTTWGTIKSLYR
ncbi:MAG: hypothetical protein ABIK85_06565 [Candidatus Eisenbacteria bacterium]